MTLTYQELLCKINKPNMDKCYVAYSHQEIKWGKDLSWTKIIPIEDNTEGDNNAPELTLAERKRIELYLAAMKGTFEMGNGGNGFIALKYDTRFVIGRIIPKCS